MQTYARSVAGVVAEVFATDRDITTLFPRSYGFRAAPANVAQGWLDDGTTFTAPPPPPPPGPRYVPLPVIRDRVTAANKWAAFATALDGLTSDKRWHLLTLSQGVAPDDADARALLTSIGLDPNVILA